MNTYKIYYPYVSNRIDKKYFIYTKTGKKVFFGAKGYEHFTNTKHYKSHSDTERRDAYERRHKKNEDWNDPDSSGFWSLRFLWKYPTEVEAMKEINKFLKSRGYI
jgi:hypothetical protein